MPKQDGVSFAVDIASTEKRNHFCVRISLTKNREPSQPLNSTTLLKHTHSIPSTIALHWPVILGSSECFDFRTAVSNKLHTTICCRAEALSDLGSISSIWTVNLGDDTIPRGIVFSGSANQNVVFHAMLTGEM
jgi:hypothetical protein